MANVQKNFPLNSYNRKLRLGRLNYANVAPLYHFFDEGQVPPWLEVIEGNPAALNRWMAEGLLDVSPVSSFAYAMNCHEWSLLPGLCISCNGPVMSVLLASKVPINELDGVPIYITRESATSTELLKLILEKEGVNPQYLDWAPGDKCELPEGALGAMVIGDRALRWRNEADIPFFLDLGEYWYSWIGLPFVFAVFAVRKDIVQLFNRFIGELSDILKTSLKVSLSGISSVIPRVSYALSLPLETIQEYFGCLNYELGQDELIGMEHFFRLLQRSGAIKQPVNISFCAREGS